MAWGNDGDESKGGEMLELCGLWLQESKGGKKYMSGSLGGVRLMVFKYEHKKEGENTPDYRIMLVKAEKRQPPKASGGSADWES